MINTTIAHYKITAKLSQGRMGAVYRAPIVTNFSPRTAHLSVMVLLS